MDGMREIDGLNWGDALGRRRAAIGGEDRCREGDCEEAGTMAQFARASFDRRCGSYADRCRERSQHRLR